MFTHHKTLSLDVFDFKGACNKRLFISDTNFKSKRSLLLAQPAMGQAGVVDFLSALIIHIVTFLLAASMLHKLLHLVQMKQSCDSRSNRSKQGGQHH